MKFLVVLVIVSCAVSYSECGLTTEQLQMMKQTIKDCAAKEGATEADVQDIFDHKPPSSHAAKCTAACVAESAGMIKDSKLDLEGSVAVVSKADPSKADMAREIGTACLDVTDADRCEAAFKIFHCIHETAVAKGLKMTH